MLEMRKTRHAWLGCVPWLAIMAWAAPPALAQEPGSPAPTPHQLCENAIVLAEREVRTPARLVLSIARVESGRLDPAAGRVRPWPWTINSDGLGSYFATKADAVAAVTTLRARGVRSIDVGCMQVNLRHHPQAFADLHEAFDPPANARYAVRFLMRLRRQTGDWVRATAYYHSQTQDLGEDYARRVLGPGVKFVHAALPRLPRRPDAVLPPSMPADAVAQPAVKPLQTMFESNALELGVPGLACPANRC